MKDPQSDTYVIGIVGGGAMGQGIAQVSALGGIRTLICDAQDGAAEAAKARIARHLDRMVEKGRLDPPDAKSAIDRIEPVGMDAFKQCDAVVEAVFEDLEVKTSVFRALEAIVSEDCLLATNTSSIPVASLARICTHRGRVAGLHFFNPVPLMKLVEVIRSAESRPETVDALVTLGRRMGRVPVTVADAPGFLVNMGGRAFTTEGARIAHEGVATPAQIDAVMRDCHGFRMGPFELMDLTGIDVNFPVSNIIYQGYFQDPRLKTSPNHAAMFEAGLLGRKTDEGWYRYENGKPQDRPSGDLVVTAAPVAEVQLAEPDEALVAFLADAGIAVGTSGPVVAAPVGEDATHLALRTGVDHRVLVCLDLSGNTSTRITLMTTPGADPIHRDGVGAALIASGRAVTAIRDSAGFIGQRLCAMITNLGCYMAEIGLADTDDIDLAMTLGLNYPTGPIALGEATGPDRVLRILEQAQAITGEDRYRPTQWLKRRALLGLPLATP